MLKIIAKRKPLPIKEGAVKQKSPRDGGDGYWEITFHQNSSPYDRECHSTSFLIH